MADQENVAVPRDAAASRALTVLRPRAIARVDERPLSGFLTQLIACERRLPAYRSARTVEPERGAAFYGAGPTFRRSAFERVV